MVNERTQAHSVRLGPDGVWYCTRPGCRYRTEARYAALVHAARQWVA